ncbi:LuxR C-terminal-related transcriptional regulator [Variovorax sp. PCZ-1]|uniref:helix-turn-helix transcriptional regulator n=1 Tax=Variovorax sp. PCZ-1 TaxID=2835533 RepID=UPI001BCB59E5|nr:LuxR C-terminal-related transcriptional regulator [Variovorax sp. PCZ-1]MBS7807334.1 LuxR family transcriptional regulator [Variovorax sp. PCZ-1]
MNTSNNSTLHSLHSQQGFIGQRPPLSLSPESGQLLAHALDEIACGVIIVDVQGKVQHCNLAGQVLLQRGQLLKEEAHRLQATQADDAEPLQQALAKAAQGKRSMLTLGAQAQSTVAVVPLDRHERSAPTSEATESTGSRIALIFSRSGMCETLMMSFFARAYQLTRSEEQILSLICVGHTAPEMAKQLNVGEATVRTHIRSICQKTHSHGIREVVKRLALLPPLMAAVMPSAFA